MNKATRDAAERELMRMKKRIAQLADALYGNPLSELAELDAAISTAMKNSQTKSDRDAVLGLMEKRTAIIKKAQRQLNAAEKNREEWIALRLAAEHIEADIADFDWRAKINAKDVVFNELIAHRRTNLLPNSHE